MTARFLFGKSRRLPWPATIIAAGLLISIAALPAAAAPVSVKVDQTRVLVETATLSAVFERATLISLVRKTDNRELIKAPAAGPSSVYLIYANAEAVPFGNRDTDHFTPYRINARKAEFRVEGFDGDGVMTISADPATNDLIIEVGMASSRPGVRSCRWLLSGIDPELELVAPVFQGIKLPLEDPLIANTFWNWPHRWESPLAILQGKTAGLWVRAEDTRNLFKNLQVGVPGQPRPSGSTPTPTARSTTTSAPAGWPGGSTSTRATGRSPRPATGTGWPRPMD